MTESDAALLDVFCDHLWLEDGLSKNTLEAYRRDLTLFGDWLARRGYTTTHGRTWDCARTLACIRPCSHRASFDKLSRGTAGHPDAESAPAHRAHAAR